MAGPEPTMPRPAATFENLDLYRTIFEGAAQGMVVQDAQGTILSANPAAEALLGLSSGQMHARTSADPCWQAVREDGSPFPGEAHPAMVTLRTGRPVDRVVMGVFNPALARRVWIEISSFPVLHPETPLPTHAVTTFVDVSRRVEAEVDSRMSSQRFRSFFGGNASVMMIVDPLEGTILDANEAATAFYGYDREHFKGLDLGRINMLSPERIREERLRAVDERRQFFLFPHRLASGEVRTVEVYSTPIHEGGRTVLLSIIHDITGRTRSEKALFASEAKFTKTFHGAPMPMALSELQTGCFLDINTAFETTFGYPHEELMGRSATELGMITAKAQEQLRQLVADHGFAHEFVLEILTREGERLTVMVSAETVTVGDRTRLLSIWQDLTARRRAEEEVQRLNNLMRQSQALTQVGGWEIDLIHQTLYWTEETYRIHELDPATFTPTVAGAIGFYAPESVPLIEHAVQAAIENNQGFDLELALVTATGRRITVHATGRPVQEAGKTIGVVGAFRDVTQAKREEEERRALINQLSQAQKMESLGSLAGGIAHDMNNVLAAVLAMASAHLTLHPEASPTREAFATIAEAAARGGSMVKGLLNFARRTPAEARSIDANLIVREVLGLLTHTTLHRIVLSRDLEPQVWPIRGDAAALANAVMNLCVNAVDAMEDEGTLTLRTRNLDGQWVEISVEDTGSGMSEEVLARAMEPFYTTKETGKGTGLGLSSAYSTVKAHQGELEIRSEPGRGTLAMMRFPKDLNAQAEAKPVPGPSAPAGRGALNLLVVDDDDLVLRTTRITLELLGHTVTAVPSGEEGLRCLAEGLAPDLLVLDLNMPGLGGARTLAEVRISHPELPVLLATGRTDQTALDLVDAHPGVTLLAKPFDLDTLQAHLNRLPGRD